MVFANVEVSEEEEKKRGGESGNMRPVLSLGEVTSAAAACLHVLLVGKVSSVTT